MKNVWIKIEENLLLCFPFSRNPHGKQLLRAIKQLAFLFLFFLFIKRKEIDMLKLSFLGKSADFDQIIHVYFWAQLVKIDMMLNIFYRSYFVLLSRNYMLFLLHLYRFICMSTGEYIALLFFFCSLLVYWHI